MQSCLCDAPPPLSEDVRLEWTVDLPPRKQHGFFHGCECGVRAASRARVCCRFVRLQTIGAVVGREICGHSLVGVSAVEAPPASSELRVSTIRFVVQRVFAVCRSVWCLLVSDVCRDDWGIALVI